MKTNFYTACLLALFSLSTLVTQAQKKYLFKVKYLPNKTYKSRIVNNISMESDFKVDSVKRNQMISSGMKLPMLTEVVQNMEVHTKTGASRADKQIPMVSTYNKISMTQKMNGNDMPINDSTFYSVKVYGRALEGGQTAFDSISGNIKPELKTMIRDMMQEFLKNIAFPQRPIKIGDTFTLNIPMNIPLGTAPMTIIAKADYTLKEVKRKIAVFAVSHNFSLDYSPGQSNASATGSGTGKMVYDLRKSFVIAHEGENKMDLTTGIGDMDMNLKTNTKISVNVTLD